MIVRKEKNIELLSFPLFSTFKEIENFVTTRNGITEGDNYSAFNLSPYCGDNPARVKKNREQLASVLNITPDRLITPFQTHGNRIFCLDSNFFLLNSENKEKQLLGIDSLITSCPRTAIAVSTADCVPVLLFDPVNKVIAAIHAGWRGTVSHIVSKTIEEMKIRYNTTTENLFAAIGPSIGPEYFEVGDEVFEAFRNAGYKMEYIAGKRIGNKKYHIDLWGANTEELLTAGLSPDHINVSGLCTYSHNDKFFSARKLGISSGRILTGIMLNKS
ncbi:peptidoglycan editing factor PgeF [Barnesiella propionica]|uniref:peptidoglycan editing factor PgeF n=1 Tax=Barnesiella propionica TaxID=2981781 RepID=UPI0011CBEA24|nr:peptidoglycan editing factor PgeF [Barnesiella propionica]MCU6768558.1 peptidoglycan editing factor PgeF [Barnesiella propionica]